jgi:hypothetical protein
MKARSRLAVRHFLPILPCIDRPATAQTGSERPGDETIPNPGVYPLALAMDGGGFGSRRRWNRLDRLDDGRLRLLDGRRLVPDHRGRWGKLALDNVIVAMVIVTISTSIIALVAAIELGADSSLSDGVGVGSCPMSGPAAIMIEACRRNPRRRRIWRGQMRDQLRRRARTWPYGQRRRSSNRLRTMALSCSINTAGGATSPSRQSSPRSPPYRGTEIVFPSRSRPAEG